MPEPTEVDQYYWWRLNPASPNEHRPLLFAATGRLPRRWWPVRTFLWDDQGKREPELWGCLGESDNATAAEFSRYGTWGPRIPEPPAEFAELGEGAELVYRVAHPFKRVIDEALVAQETTAPATPRLRLHPDGHWMPDTPGQWDYIPDARRTEAAFVRVTVYEFCGGLNVRFPGGREESVRIVGPGTWEWVTPTGDERITP